MIKLGSLRWVEGYECTGQTRNTHKNCLQIPQEKRRIILSKSAVEWLPFHLLQEVSGLILDPEVGYSDLMFFHDFPQPLHTNADI
jgi:hypothetical protein